MAVAVVSEDNDINQKYGKEYLYGENGSPGESVIYLENKKQTQDKFSRDEKSRQYCCYEETEYVKAIDINLEFIYAD